MPAEATADPALCDYDTASVWLGEGKEAGAYLQRWSALDPDWLLWAQMLTTGEGARGPRLCLDQVLRTGLRTLRTVHVMPVLLLPTY